MAFKFTIALGLLTVQAKYDKATVSAPSSVNLCHGQPGKEEHEHLPLTQTKSCAKCGVLDMRNAVLDKGVKTGQTYVVLGSADEIEEERAEYGKTYLDTLNVVAHDAETFLARTSPGEIYYITPQDAGSEDHYQLLVRLVRERSDRVLAGLFTPRSRTSLFRLLVRDGVLCMEIRGREQSMKPVPSVGGVVNDVLYAVLAGSLDQFTVDYDPATYEDQFATAIEARIANGEQVTVGADDKPVAKTLTDEELIAKLQNLPKE